MKSSDNLFLRDSEDLLENSRDISNWLKGEKSESLRLDCMNFSGVYRTTVISSPGLKKIAMDKIRGKKAFDSRLVYDIKAYGLSPIEHKVPDAVKREGATISLDLSKLVDFEAFKVEVHYRMNDEFCTELVKYRASPEPLEDSTKYHLSAQLKDPENLNKGFSEIEIEEYPVEVEVLMKQHINTNIAPFLKKLSAAEALLLSFEDEHDLRAHHDLKTKQIRLKREAKNRDISDWLNEMRDFLRPKHFLEYIDEDQSGHFRLYNCEWGNLFQALGLVPLPEKMRIINRTDLSSENPAKSGEILYKSQKFSQEFKDMFGSTKKKTKFHSY